MTNANIDDTTTNNCHNPHMITSDIFIDVNPESYDEDDYLEYMIDSMNFAGEYR